MAQVESKNLEGEALSWAVAKCRGLYIGEEPQRATNEDVEKMAVPFTLYDVVYCYEDDELVSCTVKPVTVNDFSVNVQAGATKPTASFVTHDGRRARGSVNMFYLTEDEALKEVAIALHGDIESFDPVNNREQGARILEEERIATIPVNIIGHSESGAEVSVPDGWVAFKPTKHFWMTPEMMKGETPLIAGLRCLVFNKLGPTVDVPDQAIKKPRAPAFKAG